MSSSKRNRARILTASGLKKLREQMRSHEVEENAGFKYTLERLGELTGLDPETVKNVVDCKGSDKRTIARCFESFGLTLEDSDHIPATQAAVSADPNFVGRDEAIADLNTLVSRNARVIVIQARGGVGKTTLARKYLQQEFGSFLEFPIAKETKDIASIEGLIEEKLRQLGEEPGREFLVSLDRLKRKLQAERIGILIDNLEPALDSAGKFIEAHRRYVELLRVLSDPIVQSITLITSRERLREADVTVQHYSLRSLDVQAWEQFFQSRSINTHTPALATLHDAYGGNAKAMDIISGTVLEDFSGDVGAYWQANQDDLFIERDLEDLVTKQFDRLQELDPDAYKLLCRMGCYRYQDVPTVPIEGLFCLLWDIPENRHRRVIKSLQDRSLIDFENGEFWLHPVIRTEAISRLKFNKDWEIATRKTSEFWTGSVQFIETIENALTAFEAYHHHIETSDYEKAAIVLLKRRYAEPLKKTNPEALGRSFLRLGLFQQVVPIISMLIENIESSRLLSELNNILGSSKFLAGEVHSAIHCYEESIKLADVTLKTPSLMVQEKASESRLQEIKSSSLFYCGFCNIYLWELEESIKIFEKFKKQLFLIAKVDYEEDYCKMQKTVSHFCLAFLYSTFGDIEKALFFLSKTESELKDIQLLPWGTGNRLVFMGLTYKNLGNLGKAFEKYQETISYSKEIGYEQLQAKALCCLAELYRMQGLLDVALSVNIESINFLEKIGTKCELAEAYYQLGLTYQKMSEAEKRNESFYKATQLFGEMGAPKQVERVRQSMQN